MEAVEVCLADIRCLASEEVYLQKLRLVPAERREQITRCRNSEDRMRGLGAGLLLEYGLRRRGLTLLADAEAYKRVRPAKGRYGKPYLLDWEGLHFNLSHAGRYVAAVFAGDEAGIDIERIRPGRLKVAERFFSPEEYRFLTNAGEYGCGADGLQRSPDGLFTAMWTRKESYIKAVGDGMHLPLAGFSVLSDVVEAEAAYYFKTWEEPPGYELSVCAKAPFDAKIKIVDLLEII